MTTETRDTFGAPRGSVRAILALCVAGSSFWLLSQNTPLPDDLIGSLLLVFGYYFADRAHVPAAQPVLKRPPLWLPAGAVRALLIIGFVAALSWLYWNTSAHPVQKPVFAAVITLAAFVTGRTMKYLLTRFLAAGKTKATNIIGDAKGAVSILAGAGVVAVFCFPELPLPDEWRVRFSDSLPSIISFYFGTR